MGNQHSDTNRVIITEMGAAGQAGQRGADDPDAGNPLHATRETAVRGRAVNPYFIAAWLLATAMVGIGVMSLTYSARQMGGYMPTLSGPGMPEITTFDMVMGTLIYPWGTGSLLLAGGCLLAGVLLAVHGINLSRRRSDVGLAVQT